MKSEIIKKILKVSILPVVPLLPLHFLLAAAADVETFVVAAADLDPFLQLTARRLMNTLLEFDECVNFINSSLFANKLK